jgi:hypothetical protein
MKRPKPVERPSVIPTHTVDAEVVSEKKAPPAERILMSRRANEEPESQYQRFPDRTEEAIQTGPR